MWLFFLQDQTANKNKQLLRLKDACLKNVLKIYQIKVTITKCNTWILYLNERFNIVSLIITISVIVLSNFHCLNMSKIYFLIYRNTWRVDFCGITACRCAIFYYISLVFIIFLLFFNIFCFQHVASRVIFFVEFLLQLLSFSNSIIGDNSIQLNSIFSFCIFNLEKKLIIWRILLNWTIVWKIILTK